MRRLLYLAALSLVALMLVMPTAWAQDDATEAQARTSLLIIALVNAGAGLAGGITSAYVINNRSLLSEADAEEAGIDTNKRSRKWSRWASYLGNGGLGFVAAGVFWAGYGAYSTADVMGEGALTYISLATSFFVGMGGTKWLQSERDKGRWQAAAGSAALAKPDPQLQLRLSLASSDQAPQIAANAAFKRYSSPGGSSRAGGKRTRSQDSSGPPQSEEPREDYGRSITAPPGPGDGARAGAPNGRDDTVRAIGKSPEQEAGG